MLKSPLVHPEILSALAYCGHGSKVLIADGNYPIREKSGAAVKVYLAVTMGTPTVTEILHAVHGVVEIEKAEVMVPETGEEPPIFAEFRKELGDVEFLGMDRQTFYDACTAQGAVVLAISTGEPRVFSNILLTIGCVSI